MKIKLQKFIADSGYCSRRKAEDLILTGKVKVNNEKAVIGMRVDKKDEISINNLKIELNEDLVYIALNKPKNYSCTNKEIDGEKNVFSIVETKERVFIVGRLDKDSRGLVLLTNDGDFSYRLTHPSFCHEKEYEVETSKEIDKETIGRLLSGVDIKEKTKAKMEKIEKIGFKKYRIILTEGRNRQIRRMFEVFDCTARDIKRTRIDKYCLGDLKEGCWKYINK